MFLRKRTTARREPAAVTMSGVRMGERLLQLGVDDARLAGVLAAKVGLSGHAAVAVTDDTSAERARHAAADAGVLIEVRVAPLDALPFPDDDVDVVIVHGRLRLGAGHDPSSWAGALRECHRVLRRGGRIIVVEGGTRTGVFAQWDRMFRRQEPDRAEAADASALAALAAAGFRPVRIVGELDGFRFTEGLKSVSR